MEPGKANRSQQSQKPGEKPEARGQKPKKPSLGARSPRKTPQNHQKHPRRGKEKNLRVHRGVPGEGLRKKGYFSIRPPSWAPPPFPGPGPPPPFFFCFLGLCSCCLGPVVGAVLLLLPLPCPMPCPCPVLQKKKPAVPAPFWLKHYKKGGLGGFREGFQTPIKQGVSGKW